jgi:Type II secretion system (T2SS), protein K
VGKGYFWLIRPNQDTDQQYDYGIVDECSKLNLNTNIVTNSGAFSTQLLTLPTPMTQDVADAIWDWRSNAAQATSDGAESDYYSSLTPPYECKNALYETVEELLLVRGVTPQILFGYDLNRDGVIDASERDAQGAGSMFSGAANESRGIFQYLTVYSTGETAANNAPGGRAPTTARRGLINVNTASEAVLMAIGLQQAQADTLIQQRSSISITSSATLQQALGGAPPPGFLTRVTFKSDQYSADIVAVSGDGRSFKRVRIVVDCQKTPSKIVYRRDLSGYGWPLDPAIRAQLRSGQAIETGVTGTASTGVH